MTTTTHQEFLTLYKPLHERLTRYCSSNAYGLMETEDLVQETILATLQHFNRINDKQKLLSYMIGVANNIVKNLLRRQKFKGTFDEKAALKLEGRIGNPEVALDIHYLYKALNQMPLKDKEAVILFEVNGFSIREISEMQHASEGATKTRLSRARQKLKELLTEELPQSTAFSKTQVLFSICL
ncbi:MAG: RNA polymerase sigma factor [Chitinophagales bacterium]